MKAIRLHKRVAKDVGQLDFSTRRRLTELLASVAEGVVLRMPISRPMSIVANGAHELRIKDRSGQYRVFYFTKSAEAILVFHLFKKKTQETPPQEINTAIHRLKEMQ